MTIGGNNVYEQVEIDYRMSELQAKDILAILSGEKSERLPIVIESTANDNVFVFWSGHGVPGALCWNDDAYGIMVDHLDVRVLFFGRCDGAMPEYSGNVVRHGCQW